MSAIPGINYRILFHNDHIQAFTVKEANKTKFICVNNFHNDAIVVELFNNGLCTVYYDTLWMVKQYSVPYERGLTIIRRFRERG